MKFCLCRKLRMETAAKLLWMKIPSAKRGFASSKSNVPEAKLFSITEFWRYFEQISLAINTVVMAERAPYYLEALANSNLAKHFKIKCNAKQWLQIIKSDGMLDRMWQVTLLNNKMDRLRRKWKFGDNERGKTQRGRELSKYSGDLKSIPLECFMDFVSIHSHVKLILRYIVYKRERLTAM